VSAATRRAFLAKYEGNCGACNQPIAVGDAVFYASGNEAAIGLECCGDRPDDELVVYQLPGEPLTADDEHPAENIAKVLPRNRTRADMCPTCWQIPANNGACGCHY
jgi:hypothetical protein